MRREADVKINNLLDEDVREKTNSVNLRITDYALNKAKAYSKIICAISHEPGIKDKFDTNWEGYGYLLKQEWGLNDIVDEAFFAEDQDVSSAYVRVSAAGVQKAVDSVSALDYQIVGWWHSHGAFNVFHSGTDINNFITVTKGVAPNTMYIAENINPVKDGDYAFFDKVRLENLSEDTKIMRKVERDPFAYSLVVNKRGDQYIERREVNLKTGRLRKPKIVKADPVMDNRTFNINDIEYDIRVKLGLRPAEPERRPYGRNGFANHFVDKCFKYLGTNKNPQLEKLLNNVGKAPINQIYAKSCNGDNSDFKLNPDDVKNRLESVLVRSQFSSRKNSDAYDLFAGLLFRFMVKFDVNNMADYCIEEQKINECNEKSGELTRALCRYAQLPITNGKENLDDARRMNGFLNYLNTDKKVDMKPNFKGKSNTLFIYGDRLKINNQFVNALRNDDIYKTKNPFMDRLLNFSKDYLQNEKPEPAKLKEWLK